MTKRSIIAALFLTASAAPLWADAVQMADGTRLLGEVRLEGDEYEITTDHGIVWVKKSEVKRVLKEPEEITKQADEARQKARALYEESRKMEDPSQANARLKEAITILQEQVFAVYRDARDLFDTNSHNYLDDKIQKIVMELRLYRGGVKTTAVIPKTPAKDAQPEPKPDQAGAKPDPEPTPEPVSNEPDPAFGHEFEKMALDELMKEFLETGDRPEEAVRKLDGWWKNGNDISSVKLLLAEAFYKRAAEAWDKSRKLKQSSLHFKAMADIRKAGYYDRDNTEYKTLLLDIVLHLAIHTKNLNEASFFLTEAVELGSELIDEDEDNPRIVLALAKAHHLRGVMAGRRMTDKKSEIRKVVEQIQKDFEEARDGYKNVLDHDDATEEQKNEAEAGLLELDQLQKQVKNAPSKSKDSKGSKGSGGSKGGKGGKKGR